MRRAAVELFYRHDAGQGRTRRRPRNVPPHVLPAWQPSPCLTSSARAITGSIDNADCRKMGGRRRRRFQFWSRPAGPF